MGDRITFRERTPGVCSEVDPFDPAAGASICEPRVKFVRGWLTGGVDPADGSVECGDGTDFCMEVTPSQLWEAFYRVKDAWFTSGSGTPGSGDPIVFNGIDPTDPQVVSNLGDGASWQRGYNLAPALSGGAIPAAVEPKFEAPYTVEGNSVYEAKDDLTMWYGLDWPEAVTPLGAYASWIPLTPGFSCGFNHCTIGEEPASPATAPTYYGFQFTDGSTIRYACYVRVYFSGQVAYVGADHPFDPAATLYLGLRMEISGVGGLPAVRVASTQQYLGSSDSGAYFRIGLSDSDTTAKAKLYTDLGYTFTDFVLTAKEWFPYATKTGAPAFDTTTGAPANGGPGA